jgi:hypothetical protein
VLLPCSSRGGRWPVLRPPAAGRALGFRVVVLAQQLERDSESRAAALCWSHWTRVSKSESSLGETYGARTDAGASRRRAPPRARPGPTGFSRFSVLPDSLTVCTAGLGCRRRGLHRHGGGRRDSPSRLGSRLQALRRLRHGPSAHSI